MQTTPTFQRPKRPWQANLLNWAGRVLPLDKLSNSDLNAQTLIRQAEQITGLSDWGGDEFREPLQRFLQALESDASLNLVGRRFFQQDTLRLLSNRLKLEHEFKKHPEILDVPVNKPLFVVGMFRSGTTFLHNMLAQDPNCRWLHLAEALLPTPAPEKDHWLTDPRLVTASKLINDQNALSPNFAVAHHISANKPAECSRLFEHSMIGHLFDFRANVTSYSKWVQQQDITHAYEYYRKQLQYLSWKWPNSHWVFKAPAHIYHLDLLLKVFPDASVVYIHRDPVKVLPSCCSVSGLARIRFSDEMVDANEIGDYWLDVLSGAVHHAMDVRKDLDSKRILDIQYMDFMQNPPETIENIYRYFNYDFTEAMEKRLQAWMNENPQHKLGVHRYTLEQFGLSIDKIEDAFGRYYSHSGVIKER
ncbi:MAG: sulfotransferase [Thiotrichaceae bacterium]|nr:sulfotransferase [Thiotrichaceae bacterium]